MTQPEEQPMVEAVDPCVDPNVTPVAPSASLPPAEEFGNKVFKNLMEGWFVPEIERRRAAGLIGDDFLLMMAQAIFPENGDNQVRLNGEVRGMMSVEARRDAELGEQVLLSDLEGVRSFELSDEELNCGHFTIIRRGHTNGWMVAFNALAGRKKAAVLVQRADEFLESVRAAVERQHSGPAIDNLFSCCELLAKAELIMHRSDAVRSKKHGSIASAINFWGKLGNIHPLFVDTMNRMSNLRSAARYQGTTGADDLPKPDEIEVVEAVLTHLRQRSSAEMDDDFGVTGGIADVVRHPLARDAAPTARIQKTGEIEATRKN